MSLCSGTLNKLRRRAAEAWEPCVERIREHLLTCPGVKPLGETGFRVGGRRQRLHGLRNQLLIDYRVSEKRGGGCQGCEGSWSTITGLRTARCRMDYTRCATPIMWVS